jgi:hypothetical protein
MGKEDRHFSRRAVVSEEPAAIGQRAARTPPELCRGMCLFVMACLDVLMWVFEVFRNEASVLRRRSCVLAKQALKSL